MDPDVTIYSKGLVHCSACAPADMGPAEVADAVNTLNPTGIESRWHVSDDKSFATGQPNPCPCESDASRRHWLMVC